MVAISCDWIDNFKAANTDKFPVRAILEDKHGEVRAGAKDGRVELFFVADDEIDEGESLEAWCDHVIKGKDSVLLGIVHGPYPEDVEWRDITDYCEVEV